MVHMFTHYIEPAIWVGCGILAQSFFLGKLHNQLHKIAIACVSNFAHGIHY